MTFFLHNLWGHQVSLYSGAYGLKVYTVKSCLTRALKQYVGNLTDAVNRMAQHFKMYTRTAELV